MRAAVMRSRQLRVEDVPEPSPGPGQVLVEVIACGICGSDLHTLKFPEQMVASAEASGAPFVFDIEKNVIMGHEFSARVIGRGTGVTEPREGDVVVSMPVLLATDGIVGLGYSNQYSGGYAERMVLSAPFCVKVPAGLDPRLAALTEPMAVGLHTVAKSGVKQGDAALVYGCGPVGLATIAALRIAGIAPIVAADFSPTRRALARRMGAHEAVDPREETALAAWTRVDGRQPLVLFEAVGVSGMLDRLMRDAPRGSRIVVVGVCMQQDQIWPMVGIGKELNLQFVLGYDPAEFNRTLQLIADGQIDVAPLITGEVGIADVPAAFRTLATPDAHAKILVEPTLG